MTDPIDAIHIPMEMHEDFTLGPVFFYVQVKEGVGRFYVRIEVSDDRGRRFAKAKPQLVVFTRHDRNIAVEQVFRLLDLRVARSGVLRFELFANEVVVASWDMRVVEIGA